MGYITLNIYNNSFRLANAIERVSVRVSVCGATLCADRLAVRRSLPSTTLRRTFIPFQCQHGKLIRRVSLRFYSAEYGYCSVRDTLFALEYVACMGRRYTLCRHNEDGSRSGDGLKHRKLFWTT